MKDSILNTDQYVALRASVMRGVRTMYALRALGEAGKRAFFLFVLLLALSPVCELLGLMSIRDIARNVGEVGGTGEFFNFFGSAFLNTEIELQVLGGVAFLSILLIAGFFVREVVRPSRDAGRIDTDASLS